MNRAGLLVVLAIAIVVGGVFALFPQLDLMLAEPFYRGSYGAWAIAQAPWAHSLRRLSHWLIALIAAPAFIAVGLKLLWPRRPMFMSGRAVILMIATLALAPGLVANVIFKDHSGRPRPSFAQEFGGPMQFRPWWDPRGPCTGNCSFVAGEPAGAFWTLAPAALAPPPWRVAAYGAAIAFGAAVGLLRMAGGGHFFSDVVFSGIFTFLVIWIVYGILYRWRATRISDGDVERFIERIVLPPHDAIARLFARIRRAAPRD